jgi:hypothetical protein
MSESRRARARGAAIAFYLDNFEGGGVQKTTLTLAGALAGRGHPVALLVCRPSGALQDQVPPDVEVVALGEPSAWSARVLRERAGLFTLERPLAPYERRMPGEAPIERPAAAAEPARLAV